MLFRKIIAALLCAAILTGWACAAPEVSARAAILLDADSGRVLYVKNGAEMLPIASTTKIMTALVVLENCGLDEKVRIPSEAVGVEGSSLYLKAGERLTVEQLLYGMMLRSGNDAAVALAIHCAGSVERFADMMNERARELGLSNCRFINPNGLYHENHLCSAADLAAITAEAMNNPDFAAIVATKNYTFGSRSVTNHNKLLKFYDGAVGVKTGFTKKSGRTLVGAAERDGQLLIAVTLSAPDDWNDQMQLFDYGFEQYKSRCIVDKGQVLANLPVVSGIVDNVTVVADSEFSYPAAENEEYELQLNLPRFVFAPVKPGQPVGEAVVFVEGQEVGRITLTAGSQAEEKPPEKKPSIFERLLGI